jgi:prepilin-type N-terminal cleavage/methylation domain-containing protein
MRGKTTVFKTRTSFKSGVCHAFTLIELLVVIAVIAILAALLLSAMASTKMQAQQTACLNNIKQFTLAGLMYMSDTGQFLPANVPGFASYDPNAPIGWWEAITNYGAVANVAFCPSTLYPQSFPLEQLTAGTANLHWCTWNFSNNQPASGSFGCNGCETKFFKLRK